MRYDLTLVEQGRACVDCQRAFGDGEKAYRLFSGRPNTSRDTDVRARCGTCARARGVVSALNDYAKTINPLHVEATR